jgi:hypothetical protein
MLKKVYPKGNPTISALSGDSINILDCLCQYN